MKLKILFITFFLTFYILIFNCISFPGAKKVDREYQNQYNCKIIFKANGEFLYHFPISEECYQDKLKLGYYHFKDISDKEPYLSLISRDAGLFKVILKNNGKGLILINSMSNEKIDYKKTNGE